MFVFIYVSAQNNVLVGLSLGIRRVCLTCCIGILYALVSLAISGQELIILLCKTLAKFLIPDNSVFFSCYSCLYFLLLKGEIIGSKFLLDRKGSPTEVSVTSIWALPVRGGV